MFKNNRNFKTPLLLFVSVVLIGVLIMLYPVISSNINYNTSLKKIDDYSSNVSENPDKVNKAILERAKAYNKRTSSININNSFSDEEIQDEDYLSQLDVNGNGIMGYIKIPRIDVEIPIYHGTNSRTLQKGVGHLEGSSLPIGGEGTHSILSGHRGLPSSKLFTDLDQLRENDMFYIYILDKVLAYKVDQVKVIDPSDTRDLTIVEGKDYITLVTCTPYALNTHRLLVRGKHVDYSEEVMNDIKPSRKLTISDIIFYGGLLIAMGIIAITIRKMIILNRDSELNNGDNKLDASDNIEIANSITDTVDTINNMANSDIIDNSSDMSNISTSTNTNNNVNNNVNNYVDNNVNNNFSNYVDNIGTNETSVVNTTNNNVVSTVTNNNTNSVTEDDIEILE